MMIFLNSPGSGMMATESFSLNEPVDEREQNAQLREDNEQASSFIFHFLRHFASKKLRAVSCEAIKNQNPS
jgi:hypothetical protein